MKLVSLWKSDLVGMLWKKCLQMHRSFLKDLLLRDRSRVNAQSHIVNDALKDAVGIIMITSKLIPSSWHLLSILLHITQRAWLHLPSDSPGAVTGLLWALGKVTYPLWALLSLSVKWREKSRFISGASSSPIQDELALVPWGPAPLTLLCESLSC